MPEQLGESSWWLQWLMAEQRCTRLRDTRSTAAWCESCQCVPHTHRDDHPSHTSSRCDNLPPLQSADIPHHRYSTSMLTYCAFYQTKLNKCDRSRYSKPLLATRCWHTANDLTNFTGYRQTDERTDKQDITIT